MFAPAELKVFAGLVLYGAAGTAGVAQNEAAWPALPGTRGPPLMKLITKDRSNGAPLWSTHRTWTRCAVPTDAHTLT